MLLSWYFLNFHATDNTDSTSESGVENSSLNISVWYYNYNIITVSQVGVIWYRTLFLFISRASQNVWVGFGRWCLLMIFISLVYRCGQFYCWTTPERPQETSYHITDKRHIIMTFHLKSAIWLVKSFTCDFRIETALVNKVQSIRSRPLPWTIFEL